MRRAAGAFVFLGCLLFPAVGMGQNLEQVEDLAMSGRAEEARDALTSWWEGSFEGGTRLDRQKGLWLRGLLTVDPDLAELDFQRLVVEYPGGPFTAEALVRLGGAAEARGDTREAEGYFRTLLRDYPGSRYQTLARGWLESPRGDGNDSPSTERSGSEGTRAADTLPPTSEAGSSGESPVEVSPLAEAPVALGVYAVQLGAFSSEARALSLWRGTTAAGLTTRVVKVDGNSLFRVRTGRFVTQGEADQEMARIISLGYEATVVRNADREGT